MNPLIKFLSGEIVLKKENSSINGILTVVRDLTWGTYILGKTGLHQSGGLAETIWKTVFKFVDLDSPKNVLILGLGGGSVAKLIRKRYPKAKITGIEIDPVMVDLGKKYMKLDEWKVDVVIADAGEYINNSKKSYVVQKNI